MTTTTTDRRCGQCHQNPCKQQPGCLLRANIIDNDADEADLAPLAAALPGEPSVLISELELTHDECGGRVSDRVPYFRARVEHCQLKKAKVSNGGTERTLLILKLVDESKVPLRAVAFEEKARSLQQSIDNESQVDYLFRGGKLQPLLPAFRKGRFSGVERQLVLSSNAEIIPSDEPVDLPLLADNADNDTQTTSKSNRINYRKHLEEIDRRWRDAFPGQTLKDVVVNVEGLYGKPPTTFFCVDGVWKPGAEQFCALLSEVDSEDADSSVCEDLIKGLRTYGPNNKRSMISYMSSDEFAMRNNKLEVGWYPFSDGLMNLLNHAAREWRPFAPADLITEASDLRMPTEEEWLSLSRPNCMTFLKVHHVLHKVLPEISLRREVMWRLAVYLMDAEKSLNKHHLNIVGFAHAGKTMVATLIRHAFGKVWVADVDMEHLQIGHTFDPSKAQPWMVKLFMRRVAFGEEGGKDGKGRIRPLSSKMMKESSGASTITARLMGENDLPSVRPTWAYVFLSNSSVAVQGEEFFSGDAEQGRLKRFRAPSVFMSPAEYDAYLENPDSLESKYEHGMVRLRRPDLIKQIMEGGPMYRYAVMFYVARFFNEYKQRLAWTSDWLNTDPAAEEAFFEAFAAWEASRERGPRPPAPLSKAQRWRKMSEEQRAAADAGDDPNFNFNALSGGEAHDYESFRTLLCPISESLGSRFEITESSRPDLPDLRWLLNCLFEYTNDANDRNCRIVYVSEIVAMVRDNMIFETAYKHVASEEILAEFAQDIEAGRVKIAKKKRVEQTGMGASKSKNANAVCGLKVRDAYVSWTAYNNWTPNEYCKRIGFPNPFVGAVERAMEKRCHDEEAEEEAEEAAAAERRDAARAVADAERAEARRVEMESMLHGDGCLQFIKKHPHVFNRSDADSLRDSMTVAFREERLENGGSIPLHRLVHLLYEAGDANNCQLPFQARFRLAGAEVRLRWAEALAQHYRKPLTDSLSDCDGCDGVTVEENNVKGLSERAGRSGLQLEDGTSAADKTPENPPARGTRSHSGSGKRSSGDPPTPQSAARRRIM